MNDMWTYLLITMVACSAGLLIAAALGAHRLNEALNELTVAKVQLSAQKAISACYRADYQAALEGWCNANHLLHDANRIIRDLEQAVEMIHADNSEVISHFESAIKD